MLSAVVPAILRSADSCGLLKAEWLAEGVDLSEQPGMFVVCEFLDHIR
jgi:hypothetical protein